MPVLARSFSREVGSDLIDIHRNAPNADDGYFGGNSSFPSAYASFRTDTAVASSSQNASQHFIDIYASGHWGSQTIVVIDLIGTYYRPTWWRVMMQLDNNMLKMYRHPLILTGGNNPYLEIQNSGNTSSTLAVTHNSNTWNKDFSGTNASNNGVVTWTPGTTYVEQISSNGHSGQPVYRQRIKLNTGAVYMQCYAVVHLLHGGSPRTFFSNTSISTATTYYTSNGSGTHLINIDKPGANTTGQFM